MLIVFRILLWITTGLFGLLVAVFALSYYFAARSLPDYNEGHDVAGISAPVEIVRDHSNVPHIFGETDADVFYALGFAHAQDRMWQMLTSRRTAQGRMAEIFGQRMVPQDILMRRFDLYTISVRAADALDAETRDLLQAYSDGVNAWLEEVNEGARGRGAPEMWLFNQPVSPWQPADSIALWKLNALQQTTQISAEVLRANVSSLIPSERLKDVLPDAPGTSIIGLRSYASIVPNAPSNAYAKAAPVDPFFPIQPAPFGGASNAWAAGIDRATTGSTLLANDPHNMLTAPSRWYLARLELQTGGVIGATIPGIPAVMSGRNTDLGWGITAAWADDLDLFVEEVNPDNSREYRSEQGWAEFRTRDSIVNVADGPAVTVKLFWTDNGPILPADQFDLASIRPAGHVISANWTGLAETDHSFRSAIAVMRARNVREAIRVSRDHVAPAMNVVFADRNEIGMKLIGHLPIRDEMHDSQGRMPSLGYRSNNKWKGVRSYSDNPEVLNPEGGILGNTNNKVTDEAFPNHVSFDWGDSQRVYRWQRLMQVREVHTRESFIEAQLDTVSFSARSLLPLVGANLWFTGEPAPDGTPERRRQQALDLLASWNGEMNEHLPEPLLYAAWMRALQDRLIRDELGTLADRFTSVEPVFIERVFRDIDGASVWCDVIQSEPVETCTDIARAALDEALIWLSENQGSAVEALRWGDAHTAVHTHPILSDTPVLRWFVNITQSTSGGDNTLMRGLTSGVDPRPFQNVHAAGYRGVYDFADPDSSVFVISTGQSGHPLSRYYDDLGDLWRRGEYIPMSLDPTLARAAAVGTTILSPR